MSKKNPIKGHTSRNLNNLVEMPNKIEEVRESKESLDEYGQVDNRDLTPPPKLKNKDRLDEDPLKGESSPGKVLFNSG